MQGCRYITLSFISTISAVDRFPQLHYIIFKYLAKALFITKLVSFVERRIIKMKKYKKKLLSVAVAFLSAFSFFNVFVSAEEGNSVSANMDLDIVFVIDASTSMKSSDPDKLAEEAAALFEQMGDDTIRVGYVFYSHEIVAEQDLVSKSDQKNIAKFEEGISNVELKDDAHTDISLGLTEATNILLSNQDNNRNPLIVLLSDGKTELDGYDDVSRSNAESAAELEQTLDSLSIHEIPVYTIFLDNKDTFDNSEMKKISEKTNGKNYEARASDDLKDIIQDIFSDFTNTVPLPIPPDYSNGEWEAEIPIDNESIYMANVVVTENDNLSNARLYTPGGTLVAFDNEKTKLVESDNYTLLKMLDPEVGTWTLRMKGNSDVKPEITLYNSYYFYVKQELSNSDIDVGETVEICAQLYNGEDNTVMSDSDFLSSIEAGCEITDDNGVVLENVPLFADNNGIFTGSYKIPDLGVYHFTTMIGAKDESFKKLADEEVVSVEKQLVEVTSNPYVILRSSPLKKNAVVSVRDYAVWADDLKIAASFDNEHLSLSEVEISQSSDGNILLIINPLKSGTEDISIDLTDNAGGKATFVIHTTIKNGWFPILFVVGILIVVALIIFLLYSLFRPKFKGETIEMCLFPDGISTPPQQILTMPKKKHSCTMDEAFAETRRIGSYDPISDFKECNRKFGLENYWSKVILTATGKGVTVTIPTQRGITLSDSNGNKVTKKCDKNVNSSGEEFTFTIEDNGQMIRWKFRKGKD